MVGAEGKRELFLANRRPRLRDAIADYMKGVDLIADVFPAVLDKHKNVQLIAVGPVIDLHGKFAALKLDAIAKRYPGRVYSKPEFTALPPYIFSGAEFALIPSRDEPFGLVVSTATRRIFCVRCQQTRNRIARQSADDLCNRLLSSEERAHWA